MEKSVPLLVDARPLGERIAAWIAGKTPAELARNDTLDEFFALAAPLERAAAQELAVLYDRKRGRRAL